MSTDSLIAPPPPPPPSAREIYTHQKSRAEQLCDPTFLDAVVRPHYRGGEPGGIWSTEVIQLDGSGAATVRCALDGGAPVFAKIFPGEDGPEVYRKLLAFRAAGFGDGAGNRSVEALAWYDEHRLLLCQGAAGTCLDDLFHTGRPAWAAGITAAGAWLGAFHGSGLAIGTPKPLLVTSELTSLAKRMAKAMASYPEHLDFALSALKVLDSFTHETVDGLSVQSHGQYRPYHVFVTADHTTVIDLDRSAPADPGRDVAEFIQRMRTDVFERVGSVEPANGPTRDFLHAYATGAGEENLANFRFHYARHLVHRINRIIKKRVLGSASDRSSEFLLTELDALQTGRLT